VQRTGRRLVGELADGAGDPAPHGTIVIVLGGELVGALDALVERLIAVALEHQLRRTPNIDLGYHAGKGARPPSITV
jgi:hypothetical protein